MLYEAAIRTPCLDVYGKHKFIERQFKDRGHEIRRYTWTSLPDRRAVVRYNEPFGNGFTWIPLISPPVGSKIRFQLCAHVRKCTDRRRNSGRGVRRVSNLDYADNLDWIENQSKRIGWRLLTDSVDFNPIVIPLFGEKTDTDGEKKPFAIHLRASQFDGIATIEQPDHFTQALTTGVGNAKAFGLGFIMFTVFGKGFQ